MEKKKQGLYSKTELNKIDWALFVLLAVICYFLMQHGDILHTGGSSFALLKGHILDFYDYNQAYFGANNYMISTYILFALWNIPLKLMGICDPPSIDVPFWVVMWYKALPTIFYVSSGIIIYNIGKKIKKLQGKAKLVMYVFFTTPVAFFSQFVFGQYDVFTVFFMLLGLYFYLFNRNNNLIVFSLLFGVAGTFKYFAFLFFLPLLLLKEKRINKIIKNCVVAIVPIIIVVMPFIGSVAFKSGVGGFEATQYIFGTAIERYLGKIYLVPLAWIATCVWAYLKQIDEESEIFQWSIYYCNIVILLAFGFSVWHPQWLMLAAPFMAFSLFTSERKDVLCILDILYMIAFTIFVVNNWSNNVDQHLFSLGALGQYVTPRLDMSLQMKEIFVTKDTNLMFTCCTGILLASTILKYPQISSATVQLTESAKLNWFRARFLAGSLIFILPMFICLASALNSPMLSWAPDAEYGGFISANQDNMVIEQVVIPDTDTLSTIQVKIGTYERINDSKLAVEIAHYESGNTVLSQEIDVPQLIDNAEATIEFDPIAVERGEKYVIRFLPTEVDNSNCIAIYHTNEGTAGEETYACINGERQNYDLYVKIYGE